MSSDEKNNFRRDIQRKCKSGLSPWFHCLENTENQNGEGSFASERTIYFLNERLHVWLEEHVIDMLSSLYYQGGFNAIIIAV